MRTNTFISILILFVLFTGSLTSCIDDSVPPQIPPVQSFEMDFSNFEKEDKSAAVLIENWLFSSTSVAVFSSYASLTLMVPTAVYHAALTQTPEYQGDHQWLWSFNVPVIGATYSAKLTGTVQKRGKVNWQMHVDKLGVGGFTDFLWFEGESVDSTKAEWTIYENPVQPTEVISMIWSQNLKEKTSSLKYSLSRTTDKQYNSTIEAGIKNDDSFNRFYKIYQSDEQSDIEIEWNSTSGTGRVKSPVYYKDEAWHCWNVYLLDDFCD